MSMDADRVKAGLTALIRAVFPHLLYFGNYPARVVAQHPDGSLDLVPDDPTIGGHSNVPLRYGVPGVKAKVANGGRVVMGFYGGDPQHPYAEVWETSTVTELDVDATLIKLNGGTAKVGRVGDEVSLSTNPADPWIVWFTALTAVAGPPPFLLDPVNGVKIAAISSGAAGVKA